MADHFAHNLDLDPHRYVWVDPYFIARSDGPTVGQSIPAVWWGVSLTAGRTLGCHVLLENRALVLDLPLMALHCKPGLLSGVTLASGPWDCFSDAGEIVAPAYLDNARVYTLDRQHDMTGMKGRIWFGVDFHDGNGYSRHPAQHKILWVIAMDHGGFAWLPQDQMLVHEESFTDGPLEVPKIKRQELVWRNEGWTDPKRPEG
jgi:hypothetical protein